MTKRLSDEERVRKAYSPDGMRSQRMFNFRMDAENHEWLRQQPNKGRLLNQIIEEYRTRERPGQ